MSKPSKQGTCINCDGALLASPKVFQGLVICDTCNKIVEHRLKKVRAELQMVFQTYLETIRIALIKKQMHLPTLPKIGEINEDNTKGPGDDSQVPQMRGQ